MNWVDFLIIIIVLIFIVVGCLKGFVFSILSLFGGTVNFTLSIVLCRPVSNLINNIFKLDSALVTSFSSKLSKLSSNFDISLSSFNSEADLNSYITNTINNSSLSSFSKKILNNSINITPEDIQNTDITLNNIISKSLATFISIIISFIIIFILIYLLLWLISFLSRKANQISDIKFTDRLLGTIFGFIRGTLIIVFMFIILSFFSETGLLSGLFNQIHQSPIGNWLYSNINNFTDKYINLKDIAKNIIDSL